MFGFISLLVEENIFDTVDVFFLIVGHTHASIDQFFSVLSKKIMKSDFIGSPLSLHNLLAGEHCYNLSGNSWERMDSADKPCKAAPLLVRKLEVVYDLRASLKGMIDSSIKYYSIPHRFKFEKYMGICTMQYSIFSTQDELLPRRPTELSGNLCLYK